MQPARFGNVPTRGRTGCHSSTMRRASPPTRAIRCEAGLGETRGNWIWLPRFFSRPSRLCLQHNPQRGAVEAFGGVCVLAVEGHGDSRVVERVRLA